MAIDSASEPKLLTTADSSRVVPSLVANLYEDGERERSGEFDWHIIALRLVD